VRLGREKSSLGPVVHRAAAGRRDHRLAPLQRRRDVEVSAFTRDRRVDQLLVPLAEPSRPRCARIVVEMADDRPIGSPGRMRSPTSCICSMRCSSSTPHARSVEVEIDLPNAAANSL
jgi:hypothetical protein